MGSNTSKYPPPQPPAPSAANKDIYSNHVRAYATWGHGAPLASSESARFATKELQNLHKHHQTLSLNIPREKPVTPSLHQRRDKRKPKLNMKKSRSMDNLASKTMLVTAEQLLYGRAKSKERDKSPSQTSRRLEPSGVNVLRSSSSLNVNQMFTATKRKKIPNDFTFVAIDPKYLQNAREIGKGNFSTVYHAIYKGIQDVAIKTLHRRDEKAVSTMKTTVDYDACMRELLHEAHIMTRLKHANLLQIIGVTFFGEKQHLSIVTDFMKNGSLLDYLRKNRKSFLESDSRVITMKLNSFAGQIFEAMSYLEERNVIHRDLAARNCLIGEGDILKVGDFGLTTLTDCGLYKGTYRSICHPRWTSPEAVFSSKYSSRSDVWSYEIYSLGDRPFGDMSNYPVRIVLKNFSENLSRHLPKPQKFASDELYTHIILLCLTYNVAMRPRFRDLRERLVTILLERS